METAILELTSDKHASTRPLLCLLLLLLLMLLLLLLLLHAHASVETGG